MGSTTAKKHKNQQQEQIMSIPVLVKASHLPNIDNNCYLISALEILYSMAKIKDFINFTSQGHSQQAFYHKIKKLFKLMKKKQKMLMEKQLDNLFLSIQEQNSEIDFSQQQDIIVGLNAIIDELRKEDQAIQSFFSLQYTKICGCPDNLEFKSNYIQRREFCSSCKQQVTKAAHATPIYIICIADDYHIGFEDSFRLVMKSKGQQNFRKNSFIQRGYSYKKLGEVLYQGNKTFGHYQTWVIQNLTLAQLQNQFHHPDISSKPRLCVYEISK